MPAVVEENAKTLGQYWALIESFSPDITNLWFRGIGTSAYELVPSLYRHKKVKDGSKNPAQLENEIVERFKERAIPFLEKDIAEPWGRLFFMQHYGMPTRLLDWSENPLVALYFALVDAKKDDDGNIVSSPVVWILDPISWNKSSIESYANCNQILTVTDPIMTNYALSPAGEILQNYPVAIYGAHNSKRIVAQRGVFVIFGKLNESMEQISLNFHNQPLLKVNIDKGDVPTLFTQLQKNGVTDSVIFPDLTGLSLEIKRYFNF
jgi:hypothetical protein